MLSAMRVMALLLRSERLGVGRPMIFKAVCVIRHNLFLLEADSMVLWIELCFCKAIMEDGGVTESALSLATLLAAFVDASGAWIKTEFVVQCESKVFETVNILDCVAVDGNGVELMVGDPADDQLLSFKFLRRIYLHDMTGSPRYSRGGEAGCTFRDT